MAISYNTVEDLYRGLEKFDAESDLVGVKDRVADVIAEGTPKGYGDVRLRVRETGGHICTVRLLLGPTVERKVEEHQLYDDTLCTLAAARRGGSGANDGGAVLAIDMFNYMDDDSVTLITGFPSTAAAREYARRRTRDSIEELRSGPQDRDELRQLWLIFGEYCIALGEVAGKTWSAISDLESFLDSPASAAERDWTAFAKPFGLRAEAFVTSKFE